MHKLGLLALFALAGCAVDATGEQAPIEPAATDEPPSMPPMIYNIGGAVVVVPGYCERHKPPTVGDPDPVERFGLPEGADVK